MKVTVCGWTGTTGSAVATHLVSAGHEVIGLTRAGTHRGESVRSRSVDFDRLESVESAFRGSDAAYLMVPAIRTMESLGLRLHQAAELSGVGHVVRLSILGGLVDRGVGLGLAHGRLDRDLEARSLSSTVLRPNGFMQNYLSMAESIGQGAVYSSNGSGQAAIVDVEDIARCVVAVLDEGVTGTFDLTGPQSLTNGQVAEALSEELGWAVNAVTVPAADSVDGMLSAGLPSWLVDRLMEIQQATREGVGAEVSAGVERLSGRTPATFARFVRHHREAFVSAREAG